MTANHKIVGIVDATTPIDGVNKETLDATVKPLSSENYVNGLILTTNNNVDSKVLLLDRTSQLTNDINWHRHKLTHSKDSTDNLDVVNKQYLDLMLNRKTFSYINGIAQEDLNMNTRQIVNLGFQTLPQHCASKEYVDIMFNCLRSVLLTRAATSQPDESSRTASSQPDE